MAVKMSRVSRWKQLWAVMIAIMLFVSITSFVSLDIATSRTFAALRAESDFEDKLAYVNNEGHLMLYDPLTRTEIRVLDDIDDVGGFAFARDGRIVYTRSNDSDAGLYIFDPSTPDSLPININPNPAEAPKPYSWSPDGAYLAFATQLDFRETLYVWDGDTSTNIMPADMLDSAASIYPQWSPDERLSFVVVHGWSGDAVAPEIYLWNGYTTVNVSQNADSWDSVVNWSRDGELMFSSMQNDVYSVYVWDGVSFSGGSPDTASFIHVAPELQPHEATWTNEGLIAFEHYSDVQNQTTKTIVLWNPQTQTVVEQIPISSEHAYSELDASGQVIISTHLASGIPSVYLDVENTDGNILFSVHTGEFSWSPTGYLAYCGIEGRYSRLLSIWDGNETWVVADVTYKPAQWLSTANIFSCNNG